MGCVMTLRDRKSKRNNACFFNRATITKSILVASLIIGSFSVKADPIHGAGSTFAAPIIARWGKLYEAARADGGDFISPDWTLNYELVGSLAGVMRLGQPELDFAATDIPATPEALAKSGFQQFPIVLGGVAIVTNMDGVASGQLQLPGAVLADIYLGNIQNWSDPAIKAANPNVTLPNLQINVLHRKDGSGSTYTFTQFLSSVSPVWKSKYGADSLISWPLGRSVEGSQAIVNAMKATKGAIAYVEYGQASRAGLAFAAIQNKAGKFVTPEPAGVQAAANSVDWLKSPQFSIDLTNQPGDLSYPITAATFIVMPITGRSTARYSRVHDLFRVAYEKGAADAAALGCVPVPATLAELIKQSWKKLPSVGG
jgi:phosphate transport system substrate-binding protein